MLTPMVGMGAGAGPAARDRGVVAMYQRSDGVKKQLSWVTALAATMVLLCSACAAVVHLCHSYVATAAVASEEVSPMLVACAALLTNTVLALLASDEAWRVRPELARSATYVAACLVLTALCVTEGTAAAFRADTWSAVWALLCVVPLACFALVHAVAIHMCILRARLAAAVAAAAATAAASTAASAAAVAPISLNGDPAPAAAAEALPLLPPPAMPPALPQQTTTTTMTPPWDAADVGYGTEVLRAADPDPGALDTPLQRAATRTLGAVAGAVLVALAVVFVASTVALALDASRLAAPGVVRAVPLDLHARGSRRIAMHVHCEGNRTAEFPYTVVLEHSAALSCAALLPLQAVLATSMRTCVYDRAGSGWSERGANVVDGRWRVAQMVWLLNSVGEGGPFVIAGHGDAGARVALATYALAPENVAGVMVLAGSPLGGLAARLARLRNTTLRAQYGAAVNRYNLARFLAPFGLTRAVGDVRAFNTSALPERHRAAFRWNLYHPAHASSMFWHYYTLRNVRPAHPDIPAAVDRDMPAGWLGRVPVLVVTTAHNASTATCRDWGLDPVRDAAACARYLRENEEVWANAQRTSALSHRGTLVACPPPCSAASLVWDHIDWLLPHIETFLQLVNDTYTNR